jgi:hypothetical protein
LFARMSCYDTNALSFSNALPAGIECWFALKKIYKGRSKE